MGVPVRGRRPHRLGDPLAPARDPGRRAGRHLLGRLLPLRRGRPARLGGDGPQHGRQPDPHRPARRAARHGGRGDGGRRARGGRRAARRRDGAGRRPRRHRDPRRDHPAAHRRAAGADGAGDAGRAAAPSSATPGSCGSRSRTGWPPWARPWPRPAPGSSSSTTAAPSRGRRGSASVTVKTRLDHRIAMSMAVAQLFAGAPVAPRRRGLRGHQLPLLLHAARRALRGRGAAGDRRAGPRSTASSAGRWATASRRPCRTPPSPSTGSTPSTCRCRWSRPRLEEALRGAHALGFQGLNVTIPHKQAAAAGLRARSTRWPPPAGAANTLRRAEDGWEGFNTDATALAQLLDARRGAGRRDGAAARRRRRGAGRRLGGAQARGPAAGGGAPGRSRPRRSARRWPRAPGRAAPGREVVAWEALAAASRPPPTWS